MYVNLIKLRKVLKLYLTCKFRERERERERLAVLSRDEDFPSALPNHDRGGAPSRAAAPRRSLGVAVRDGAEPL